MEEKGKGYPDVQEVVSNVEDGSRKNKHTSLTQGGSQGTPDDEMPQGQG